MADQLSLPSKTTHLIPIPRTHNSIKIAYGVMLSFLIGTALIIFNPSVFSSSSGFLRGLAAFRNPSFPTSNNGSHFTISSPPPQPQPSISGNNVSDVVANDTKNSNISSSKVDSIDTVPSSNQTQKNNSSISRGDINKVRGDFDGSLLNCDIYDGEWVKDDSYPLYQPGSCPHIDEPFNCFLNHRPDNGYEKYRWQPRNCNIPRLNATHMLEMLRGKRLVFVGDSLNRNMWESLVCVLRNSVQDKNKVYEVSGREEFRTEGSYSFILEDYNCSLEFFRSPFLVQEWEVQAKNGSKKETLRLDLVERQCDKYKDADFLIFNTGHWWSHDKTLKGQGYYQEGSHVYGKLDVIEAFRRAVTTWARWVDDNVDPQKTQVFFRGYAASHFGGGKWNSGGRCDQEKEPFKSDDYLEEYPPIMETLEDVLKGMKIPVFYLNITRLTDYRKDAHPSIYRGSELTEEERRSPLRYQDCAHWCLPGVPETWNEFVYAQMLIKNYRRLQEQQQHEQHRKN